MDSFNPNPTIGALLIGVLLSYLLLGVMTTQTYIYYGRFPNDPRKLKAMVAVVWVCEFAHALCIGHTLYTYTILDYGHPERLGPTRASPRSIHTSVLFGLVITTCVQGFFSVRIYALSRRLFVPILIGTLLFLRVVGSTVASAAGLRSTSVLNYESQWGWLIKTVWGIGAACDVITTTALVTVLVQQRTYAHRRTGAILDKIIAWTIETGILTTASWLVMLACFVTMKKNFIWIAVFVINARLFSNSFLASLNSRASLRATNDVSLPGFAGIVPSSSSQMTKLTHITYDAESRDTAVPKNA
ncbi:hypothetical protein C8F04DRAFT_1275456 [Mycena alexandri]|uniref:DUF6534 domain-containing protein n=1 Tax=Mycena alexandri TaxID=1745969 RepID=A0AAD6S427_9AGAR|nr:hypothetical protein C8F04DRAFT_1275456 [Mycena alexandri]